MALVDLSRASDAELLRLTPENAEAFAVLYDRFERDLLGFFLRRTRRGDLAADLCAEVFATALDSAARFDPGRGTVRAWLFGIARHELFDAWERGRVESKARQRLGIESIVLSDESIERVTRLDATGSGVLGLLDELPDDQRLAIKGRVLDERDYAEIALSLACSEGVVRQRVRRGLLALRHQLDQTKH